MLTDSQIKRLGHCRAIVCDLDGTLYLDGVPFPQAAAFLQSVLDSGRNLFYFTNNSSRSHQSYIERLQNLGFPAQDDMLISSTDCAIHYLCRHGLYPEIFLLGTPDLQRDFAQAGFELLSPEQIKQNKVPRAVVLGFDTTLTYEKIHASYELLNSGLPFIATHGDILCPVSRDRFKPDVGAFLAMFKTAIPTIQPVIVGKPSLEAVAAIVERTHVNSDQTAFIGDRLYTDIRMANHSAMMAILVLSGETSAEMAKASPDQPDLIVPGVESLIPFL
ncbi:MAG TPA: HAD-IIA family hydrolase [bacterium]|jgi:HAD superfamily hydrolase (TIGR01450 family)|nr:HAD-IIA family hydrolase [bacterium]HNT64619.1 HAD-IIA family hydrolase [bacterium]HOX85779.1 HAD-IIA family hydrolase [bacterium]HPG45238.1 HAD-IIA family hydrolase [bacterium]HPM97480.1 HAD-IIA family hydrolase [bacterium]